MRSSMSTVHVWLTSVAQNGGHAPAQGPCVRITAIRSSIFTMPLPLVSGQFAAGVGTTVLTAIVLARVALDLNIVSVALPVVGSVCTVVLPR